MAWTSANGAVNGTIRPSPGFAVFQGTGGVVTLDDSAGALGVTGMQFASDGYSLAGDALALSGTGGRTVIRVGDGSAGGAGITATIASALTGASDLVKVDRGTLTLTGANSYTGNTIVEGGTLIGNVASIRGNISNAGTLIFDQAGNASFAGTIARSGGADGAMIKRGASSLTLTGASSLDWAIKEGSLVTTTQQFTGDAVIAAGATLLFNQTVAGSYAGTLSGAGTLAIDGGHRVELTGNNTGFAGLFDVRDGRLIANGALGGTMRIGGGGFVGGNGTLGDTIVGAGGIISPGNSIGTVTINGNLVFEQGSSYDVEVDPIGSASDQIVVTGTATLIGGTVAHIGFGGTYRPSASYTILTAAGGVTGQFDAVRSDYAFLTPTLGYSANAVTLTLNRNDIGFADVGASSNQRAVAGAAEKLGFGNAIYDALVVTNAATARAGFDSLSGEIHASLGSAMIENAGFVRAAALDRLRNARTEPGVSYWMRGLDARSTVDGDGNAGRMTHQTAGTLMGADAVAGEAVQLGIFGGWQKSDVDVRSVASSADVDSWSVGFYAGGELGRFNLRAGGAFGSYAGTVKRGIAFADFAEIATADVGGSVVQGFGEIGYRIALGKTLIEPVAGIAHVALESQTTREKGDTAALHIASGSSATTFTTLGARLGQSLGLGSVQVVLDAAAGWRHAFGERRPDARVAFAGNAAQPFTIGGAPIARDMLSTELGLGITLSANARLDLRYTGDVAGSASNHGGNATFAWRF